MTQEMFNKLYAMLYVAFFVLNFEIVLLIHFVFLIYLKIRRLAKQETTK